MTEKVLLSVSNPVFSAYVFYASILIVKVIAVAIHTGSLRSKKNAFSSPEDALLFGVEPSKKNVHVHDPDIDRGSRAHRNDLENILPFLLVGLLYVLTDPSIAVSKWCFRLFAAARVIHSFAYLHGYSLGRSVTFITGLAVTLFMLYEVLAAANTY